MNAAPTIPTSPQTLSDDGKARLLSIRGEPLFYAGWERALLMHFEIDPAILQPELPYELDLRDGEAFVSLVAFTMRGMRPRIGGPIAALMFKPVATHSFLNLRTYVKHRGERGICFIAEWLSSRLAVLLGPRIYGLPYRYGKIDNQHLHEENYLCGTVRGCMGQFTYAAKLSGEPFAPCEEGTRDEFLLERYTAFNWRGETHRFFRVWHPPWPQASASVSIADTSLVTKTFPWFAKARLVGANYSPGFREVWMGLPHDVRSLLRQDGSGIQTVGTEPNRRNSVK